MWHGCSWRTFCYPLWMEFIALLLYRLDVYDSINSVLVKLLSHVRLFETPWTAAGQASLSFTISWSLLKLMSIKSVMPSNNLILCHPLHFLPSIFPSISIFSNESVFASGSQSTGASASASDLPMNIQDWFPLGLTGLISLKSKGLSRDFTNSQFKRINSSTQLSS